MLIIYHVAGSSSQVFVQFIWTKETNFSCFECDRIHNFIFNLYIWILRFIVSTVKLKSQYLPYIFVIKVSNSL